MSYYTKEYAAMPIEQRRIYEQWIAREAASMAESAVLGAFLLAREECPGHDDKMVDVRISYGMDRDSTSRSLSVGIHDRKTGDHIFSHYIYHWPDSCIATMPPGPEDHVFWPASGYPEMLRHHGTTSVADYLSENEKANP